jgi:hypothetical protein
MKARLLALLLVAATGFAVAVMAAPRGFAQGTDTGTTTDTTQGGDSGTFTVHDFKDTWWIIMLLVGLLALAWVIPLVTDLMMAYRYQRMRMNLFENLLRDTSKRDPPLSTEEMKTLLGSNFVPQSPSGLAGLSRGLMAMMIATVIAVALIALIAVGTKPDGLIKTIVTTLLAAFTTIVGFYFGARTAESAQTAGHDSGVAAAMAQPSDGGGNGGGNGSGANGGSHGGNEGGNGDAADVPPGGTVAESPVTPDDDLAVVASEDETPSG